MRRAIRSCLAAALVAGFLAAGGGQASAAPVSARLVRQRGASQRGHGSGGRRRTGVCRLRDGRRDRRDPGARRRQRAHALDRARCPCPVEVAPVYVPGNDRLYTAINGRVFALNAADGKTVVTAGLEFTSRMYSLELRRRTPVRADRRRRHGLHAQPGTAVELLLQRRLDGAERARRRVPLPERRGGRGRRLHPVPQEVRLRHGGPGGEELRLRRRLHRPDGGAVAQRRRRWRRAGRLRLADEQPRPTVVAAVLSGLRDGQRQ